MIAAFRIRDTGQTFTITHPPGPPENPYLHALHQIRLHLIAAGVELDDTLEAPYAVGEWLEDKTP